MKEIILCALLCCIFSKGFASVNVHSDGTYTVEKSGSVRKVKRV